jgi:Na+/glutamate symporter
MNGLYALTIVMLVYALGDVIATKTKAIISMLFVASIVFAVAFWNGLPSTIFTDSALQGFASVTVGLLLVHMGTTISIKDLVKEWKTVIIVLCSTIAICLGVYFIGGLIIDRLYALIGAPILGGGVVAFLVMSGALKAAGTNIVVFGSLVLVLQGVFGFPIASILCRKEAGRLRGRILEGTLVYNKPLETKETKPKWRIIPPIPDDYNGPDLRIARLALVACFAQYLSGLSGGKVNMLIICLLLGVFFREIGFLDEGELTKANGFTFVIGAVLVNVFASLANTTPALLLSMIGPLLVVVVVGLACCAVVSILVGRIFGQSWYMSFALGVTALFGFPGTFIVPNEVSKSVGQTEEEKQIIMQNLMPKMIIAGMVSVSIVSVVFAGIMSAWV